MKGPPTVPAALSEALSAHEAVRRLAAVVAGPCASEDEDALTTALAARRVALERLGRTVLADHLRVGAAPPPKAPPAPVRVAAPALVLPPPPRSPPSVQATAPAPPSAAMVVPPAAAPSPTVAPTPVAPPPPVPSPQAPPASSPREPAEPSPAPKPPRPTPEPAPPPPPARKAPAPSPESVEVLRRRLQGDADAPRVRERVERVAAALGPPVPLASEESVVSAFRAIRDAMDLIEQYQTDLPGELRQAILGVSAAIARHAQDESGLPAAQEGLNDLFHRMTQVSRDTHPGFVKGLSRSHAPTGESWLDDAHRWYVVVARHAPMKVKVPPPDAADGPNVERALEELADHLDEGVADERLREAIAAALAAGARPQDPRLVRMLLGHAEMLDDRRFRNLRKFIRQARAEVDAENDDPVGASVAEDWPWFSRTRGKVAVLVGGDRREKTEDRVRDAFGFAAVDWDSGWQPRRVGALQRRIQSGGVDIVILLARFLSHKTWDALVPVCKAAGVPFVLVERGYGLTQVRATMERVFAAR